MSAVGSSVDGMSLLNPYLSFRDTARDAMTFYKEVFGGELFISTFGDMGAPDGADAQLVMHSSLVTPAGYTLFASDVPAERPLTVGDNITISLSGTEDAELRGYFDALAKEGTVTMPLDKQVWGDVFGMVTDQFGINWMVNISDPERAQG